MTNAPDRSQRPVQRPTAALLALQAQSAQAQGQQPTAAQPTLAQRLADPDLLDRAVRALGGMVDRGTQPAQDLGAWITDPIAARLRNPFGNAPAQPRADMPGTRGTFFGQ